MSTIVPFTVSLFLDWIYTDRFVGEKFSDNSDVKRCI